MAIIRSLPRKGRRPAHTGAIMVDAVRGVLRVRKWPKKRGTPKSQRQRDWIDWFTQANELAKYADPASQVRAKEMTKGSGMYARDVLLKAMRGRLYFWADTSGWKWYSMAAIGDISETLDVLGQTIGDILVRAVDRWRPVSPGNVGQVLTHQGPDAPPAWAPAATAAGQIILPGTPITPDGTVNFYDLDVAGFFQVSITLEEIGFPTASTPKIRLSIDGGVTFKDGPSDYIQTFVDNINATTDLTSSIGTSSRNQTADLMAVVRIDSLHVGRPQIWTLSGAIGAPAALRGGLLRFNGPVTHVRIFSGLGHNFNAGTIRAVVS